MVVTSSVNAMRQALAWWDAQGRAAAPVVLLGEAFAALERGLRPAARPTTTKNTKR